MSSLSEKVISLEHSCSVYASALNMMSDFMVRAMDGECPLDHFKFDKTDDMPLQCLKDGDKADCANFNSGSLCCRIYFLHKAESILKDLNL